MTAFAAEETTMNEPMTDDDVDDDDDDDALTSFLVPPLVEAVALFTPARSKFKCFFNELVLVLPSLVALGGGGGGGGGAGGAIGCCD